MLDICAIASGSNGNCYYIGNSEAAILIDAGITRKQALLRMEQKNINPEKIKAIFVSHEHFDHACGVRGLSKKVGADVYVTAETHKNSFKRHRASQPILFNPGDVITIGDFTVHTFLKKHDAVEPCSFRVEYHGINIGVFTDIGQACENVINNFKQCQAVFLESNYDEKMLREGTYTDHLKGRITSGYGHLSNIQALNLLKEHHNPNLQLVLLSHISEENNNPDIVMETFKPLQSQFTIILTNRYAAGDIFNISPR